MKLKHKVLPGTAALLTTEFGSRHADATAHNSITQPPPSHLKLGYDFL